MTALQQLVNFALQSYTKNRSMFAHPLDLVRGCTGKSSPKINNKQCSKTQQYLLYYSDKGSENQET